MKKNTIDKEKFIAAWQLPMSNNELAEHFQVSRTTIINLCKQFGLVRSKDVIAQNVKRSVNNKYGVDNVFMLDDVKDKTRETLLQRYGVDHPAHSEEIRNKTANTNLQKYGNVYACASDEVRQHIIETNIQKYGAASALSNADVKEKIKIFWENNPEYLSAVRQKICDTNLKKYGVKSTLSNPETQQKIKDTMQRLYDTNTVHQITYDEHTKNVLSNVENLREYILSCQNKTIGGLLENLTCCRTTLTRVIHKYNLWDLIDLYHSDPEHTIAEFLDTLNISYIIGDRSVIAPLEIDIYCPQYNIGIEFNGTYWHSGIQKDKNYHLNKSQIAQEKGIRLIHIYEYEWNEPVKQNIIKSMLKIAFGKVDNRIYARNCEIREITNIEAKDFNNYNHLQGHRNAQVTYGLYYNNTLVQLMSFTYDQHNKWWEIIRGCPGSNNIVIGGVSKLFTHFIRQKNPNKIFSYCDFNKFDGKGYEAIGMKYIGHTGPDMKWVMDDFTVINRNPKQHKKLLETALSQIWGAGSKKYLWTKPE